MDLLKLLSADQYFTRSWTLQESLSALNMSVLIQVLPNIKVPPRLAAKHYASDICYTMTDFSFALEQFEGRISNARSLHLDVKYFNAVTCPAFAAAPSQRLSRSAAEVLAMLEGRSNTVLSDRLAIVANLCAYEKRLETAALESTAHGFSTAVLVLSLINGDMTLLNGYGESLQRPEIHLGLRAGDNQTLWQRARNSNAKPFGWGWGPPDRGRLLGLSYIEMRVFDTQLLRVSPANLMTHGLLTSGFLWKNETEIDFRFLKQKYRRQDTLLDQETAKAVKWETLRSLAQRGHWDLAEALWRFECYYGDFWEQGKKGYRPYALTEVLDSETYQLKRFGDPAIRGDSDFGLLFRRATTSWWLQYSVCDDGYVTGWTCDSDGGDDGKARAAFDPTTEEHEDQQGNVFVFTPFIQSNRRQFDISPAYETMSWVVSRTNEYHDGVEVLACKEQVEGFWNLDGLEPRPFILS